MGELPKTLEAYRKARQLIQFCLGGLNLKQACGRLGVSYTAGRYYIREAKKVYAAHDLPVLAVRMLKAGHVDPVLFQGGMIYFTDRELEVARTLARGYGYVGTGRRLGIKRSVVIWHIMEMKRRAGVETTIELFGYMFSVGLLS